MYKDWNIILSGGVEIRDVRTSIVFHRLPARYPVLEEYKFVAHRDGAWVSLQEAIRLSIDIALEYHQIVNAKTVELIDNVAIEDLASPILAEVLDDVPSIQANILLVTPTDLAPGVTLPPNVNTIDTEKLSKEKNILLAIGVGFLTRSKRDQLQQILPKLRNGGFVLTREKPENVSISLSKHGLDIILEKIVGKESIILLKKREQPVRKTEIVRVNNNEFAWLEKFNSIMNKDTNNNTKIILVSEKNYECGLLGLMNCLRKEPGGEMIRGVLIQDEKAPEFSLQNPLYSEQLKLDLPVNVLRPNKIWGSYRHQPLLLNLKPKHVYHAFVDQKVCNNTQKRHTLCVYVCVYVCNFVLY